MMDIFKQMFGLGPDHNYSQMVKDGAIILDVRTKGEFASGHIKGSLNIPVDQLEKNLGRLRKEETIITVCASGMRSGAAKRLLAQKGYTSVHNGGSWISLQSKI